MMTYIKLGKIRGASIEFNVNFGLKPFFQKNTFHHETIVDIPYGQIIYTAGTWFPRKQKSFGQMPAKKVRIRSASNVNKETKQTTKHTGGANGH